MNHLTLQADVEQIGTPSPLKGLELATLTTYDVPALASLCIFAYGGPRSAEALLENSAQMRMAFEGAFGATRDDSFIGAWLDGKLIGAVICVLDPPWDGIPRGPFVSELIVDPQYRRQGVATTLVKELATRAQAWGYDSLTLNLDLRKSPEALRLYQEIGFSEVTESED